MIIQRKLLVNQPPQDELERSLKSKYKKRIKEMFSRAISEESIFNIFDEIYHGLIRTNQISQKLNFFYESFLNITSYYQHSQAGRGALAVKSLQELGEFEKIYNEFKLKNISVFWNEELEFEANNLDQFQFDIGIKTKTNEIVFCEMKMKVYSGCTAGRIEVLNKFREAIKILNVNEEFYNYIASKKPKKIIFLLGILFDISGEPANLSKDRQFGLCYNGLARSKEDLLRTLTEQNIQYEINQDETEARAFTINFKIKDLDIQIISAYGDEILNIMFDDKVIHNLEYFNQSLINYSYDDIWLGQIISICERYVLNYNFVSNSTMINFSIFILSHPEILYERSLSVEDKVEKIIEISKEKNNLLDITSTAIDFLKLFFEDYSLKSYLGDIIQLIENVRIII